MATYQDLTEDSTFVNQRFSKKNNRSSKFGFTKNASPECKIANFEQCIQITGFRISLGSKHDEFPNNLVYADCSGDSSRELRNFNLKVSKPVISRVLIRTNSSDVSCGRKFITGEKENAGSIMRTELKSNSVETYHAPVRESNNPATFPPEPPFFVQLSNSHSTNLAFGQNKKTDYPILDEGSESLDTSSSVNTSSDSLDAGNISDMSSLVLSNMKNGHFSRITSFIKNIWNGSVKETNTCTGPKPQLSYGTSTVNEDKVFKLPNESFNNLNNIFQQERKQIYRHDCVLHQSNLDEKLETMTDPGMRRKSSFCNQKQESIKNQVSEFAHKALIDNASDTSSLESAESSYLPNSEFADSSHTPRSESAESSHTPSSEFAKLSPTTIHLKNRDNEVIVSSNLPRRKTAIPVADINAQNFPNRKEHRDTRVRSEEVAEIELINHEKFEGESNAESKTSCSDVTAPSKSKSIIFGPSSHNLPGNGNTTVVSLCDDCYLKTKKTVSQMQLSSGMETLIMNDKSDDSSKGNMSRIHANQLRKFKVEKDSPVDQLSIHCHRKLNVEDLDMLLEAVNNHLLGLKTAHESFLKNAMKSLNEKWIRVVSNRNSTLEEVRNILKYFQDFSEELLQWMVFSTDREGNNALHFACRNERFDVAEELLKYECGRALLTRKNKLGHSPLTVCSVSQKRTNYDWNVVKKILSFGDVNQASTFNGQTPLMNAASRGCVQMVRMLLEAGADPNCQDRDGSTALMYAAEHGHVPCVNLLLEHPMCDPFRKDYDQQTACSVALAAGRKEVALRIYLHSRKRSRNTKNLVRTYLRNKDRPEIHSDTQVYSILQTQSAHQ